MKSITKLVRLGVALITPILLLASCVDKSSEPTPPGKTDIDITEVTFDGVKGDQSQDIKLNASSSWTATLSTTTWMSVTPTSGKAGETILTLRPTRDNSGTTLRTAELTIYVDGDDAEHKVTIRQRGTDSHLSISKNSLTLTPDKAGRYFADTIEIESNRKWTIVNAANWLTFTNATSPSEGTNTKVQLIVKANFMSFPSMAIDGEFGIKIDEDDITTVKVSATAFCDAYTSEEMTTKITNLELVKDPANQGHYSANAYFNSNIEWSIAEYPSEWLKLSISKNISSSGELTPNPTLVVFEVKPDKVSATELKGTVLLKDIRSQLLMTIPVRFGGAGSEFLEIDIIIPSQDKFGEDFMFDPTAGNGRVLELPFKVRTSVDYSSIENAPYKIISLSSPRGIVERTEVHWAILKMGDPKLSTVKNGIYEKQIILCVKERRDEDDNAEITKIGEERSLNMYFVAKNIMANDLFVDATSTEIKSEYQGTFIKQKNALISYSMSVDGIVKGSTQTILSAGWQAKLFNMITDAPKFSVRATRHAPGESNHGNLVPWVTVEFPVITEGETNTPDPTRFLITVNDMGTSAYTERMAKISFYAYRGLNEEGVADEYEMFSFFVKQTK